MGGGKPTVPENVMDTLTSSDYSSAHTSNYLETFETFLTRKLRSQRRLLT